MEEEAYKYDLAGSNFYEIGVDKPKSDKNHALIQGRLLCQLDRNYGENFTILPEINLNLSDRKTVPDLAIYAPLKFDSDNNEEELTNPPLCVIDILFEGQNLHGLHQKRTYYLTSGVTSYWLVLPLLKTISVFHSIGDSSVFYDKRPLLDKKLNIELDLSEIFK
jgi:Uma2 family endonuclease